MTPSRWNFGQHYFLGGGNVADTNRLLQPKAERAMDRLKYEVAEDLNLDDDIEAKGWGNMTTRQVGKIGGNMVKRLVAKGESALAEESDPEPRAEDPQ